MIQLKSLQIQLLNLTEALEDAKRRGKPPEEISEIMGHIKVIEILIEKRITYLRRSQSQN
jgi:hypothetical protein